MKIFAGFSRIGRLMSFFVLALALAAYPITGESDAHKEGGEAHGDLVELMQEMGKTLEVLVKDLFVTSLEEEIISDALFDGIAKNAKAIDDAAKSLPSAERIAGDASLIALSRQTEGVAVSLASAANNKNLEATVKALAALHAACLNCHKEMRP